MWFASIHKVSRSLDARMEWTKATGRSSDQHLNKDQGALLKIIEDIQEVQDIK